MAARHLLLHAYAYSLCTTCPRGLSRDLSMQSLGLPCCRWQLSNLRQRRRPLHFHPTRGCMGSPAVFFSTLLCPRHMHRRLLGCTRSGPPFPPLVQLYSFFDWVLPAPLGSTAPPSAHLAPTGIPPLSLIPWDIFGLISALHILTDNPALHAAQRGLDAWLPQERLAPCIPSFLRRPLGALKSCPSHSQSWFLLNR
jgi:hypothetical protein